MLYSALVSDRGSIVRDRGSLGRGDAHGRQHRDRWGAPHDRAQRRSSAHGRADGRVRRLGYAGALFRRLGGASGGARCRRALRSRPHGSGGRHRTRCAHLPAMARHQRHGLARRRIVALRADVPPRRRRDRRPLHLSPAGALVRGRQRREPRERCRLDEGPPRGTPRMGCDPRRCDRPHRHDRPARAARRGDPPRS